MPWLGLVEPVNQGDIGTESQLGSHSQRDESAMGTRDEPHPWRLDID
jgi:hypothetical protein